MALNEGALNPRTRANEIYDEWRADGYAKLPDAVTMQAISDGEVATFTDRSLLARAASSLKRAVIPQFRQKRLTPPAETFGLKRRNQPLARGHPSARGWSVKALDDSATPEQDISEGKPGLCSRHVTEAKCAAVLRLEASA